jgi:His/Glu/Gln/Arg/opine family amino acid ABC transporter permease subunit
MDGLIQELYNTFIRENRWTLFVSGIGNTLLISLFAVALGMLLGVLAGLGKLAERKKGRFWLWSALSWFANRLSALYIDIIRGTPTVVQITVIYFIIFASVDIDKRIVAVIAFGINSGAYVAEIIRSGILSISKGQTEAGRSLGLTQAQTMTHIVMPQAIKNILPALGNEFIVLVKETAVIGYVAKIDLMAAAMNVQSRTYSYVVPLLSVAVIYYVIIKILTLFLNLWERKLRKSDVR